MALVRPGVLERERRPRLGHVPDEPARQRRAVAEEEVGLGEALDRGEDELVVLDEADRRRVHADERHGLAHDLVEHRRRVELGREHRGRAGELLRQRAGAALVFEDEAPLERSPRRAGEVVRELEVVVRDVTLVREEHEHDRDAALPVQDGNGEHRARTRDRRGEPERLGEAVVVAERGRGEDPSARDRLGQRSLEGEAPRELGDEGLRQVAAAREREPVAPGGHHGRERATERLPGGVGDRLQRLLPRERLREQRRDLREAALHADLPGTLGEDLRVPERERRQVRERLQQRELALREGAGAAPRRRRAPRGRGRRR